MAKTIIKKSAKRTKKQTISATQMVKAQARATLGTPPPSHPLPDRRANADRKTEKYKKRISDLREAESE